VVEADVVNLGFVLNVIERPLERAEALRGAFALARRCLAVSVITSSRARFDTCRAYGDGYVTRLGTFQKYYQPSELKAFIEGTLEREALPAGPGLFFVFRDPLAEQAFLASRQARRPMSPVALIARRTLAREARVEALKPELEAMVSLAYELGRGPTPEEAPPGVVAGLASKKTSLAMGLKLAEAHRDPDQLAEARARRQEELTVAN
jgi:DNA phosphorothioation-associated putative methyltransferase